MNRVERLFVTQVISIVDRIKEKGYDPKMVD
jgi:hypothetical protein